VLPLRSQVFELRITTFKLAKSSAYLAYYPKIQNSKNPGTAFNNQP